jgi:hypothetical protein
MLNPWKYIPLLALAIPTTYAFAPPSFRETAKPRWLADMSVGIGASLAAKPQAEVPVVDPIAAAKVDEDLDYRIAERTKSADAWRAFLAAHPDGPHAQSVRAELDRLTPAAPTAVQAPDIGAVDTKVLSASASPPCHRPRPTPRRLPPMRSAAATKTVCNDCPIARPATESFGC